MVCPQCGTEMRAGRILAFGATLPYWFPDDTTFRTGFGRKHIHRNGGIILDDGSSIWRYPKSLLKSYYCRTCNILITDLSNAGGQEKGERGAKDI